MRIAPWLLVTLALAGCSTAVAGTAQQAPVVGATQRSGQLDVTLLSFVDPVDQSVPDSLHHSVDPDSKLVAARFRIHNHGTDDYLVDPTTETEFAATSGTTDPSLARTSAGVMLDQVSLAPDESVVGYVTSEVQANGTVTEVHYKPMSGDELSWNVIGGTVHTAPPPPPPLRHPGAHPLGEQVTVSGDGDQLTLAPTKITEDARPQDKINPDTDESVIEVDFTASNPGGPQTKNLVLRIMMLYDAADESVQADVDSMKEYVEHPVPPGGQATWAVQFLVPQGFRPDHVSFRPEFGDKTTTTWLLS